MNAYHLELLNIEDGVVFYTVIETGFKRHSWAILFSFATGGTESAALQ